MDVRVECPKLDEMQGAVDELKAAVDAAMAAVVKCRKVLAEMDLYLCVEKPPAGEADG